ncbi:MAG: LysR substrate-binding domain-containing protein, partial [Pseudomonadota bacterium]
RKLGLPAPDHCRAVDFGIHVDQAIDATASGVGAMLGPRVLAEQDIARGRLVSPWGPELKSDVHYRLSWDRDGLNDRIESFSAWLLDQFGGGTGPVVQAAA